MRISDWSSDVCSSDLLLNQLGCSTTIEGSRPEDFGRVMTARTTTLTSTVAPYDIVRKMRASILVLGPLLAQIGRAHVCTPVTNAHLVCRLLIEQKKNIKHT